jgi:hypothetical protein
MMLMFCSVAGSVPVILLIHINIPNPVGYWGAKSVIFHSGKTNINISDTAAASINILCFDFRNCIWIALLTQWMTRNQVSSKIPQQ